MLFFELSTFLLKNFGSFPLKYYAAQLFSTLIATQNAIKSVLNQHIRMISEGSCDTEN